MADVQALETNFGETHFGKATLGDVRRLRRLVMLADRMAQRPGQSLPVQVQDKAAYQALLGLVEHPKVTHVAVLQTHVERTCSLIRRHPGIVLIIHDTTELDFSSHKSLQALGQIGDGGGQGYECHNSLAIVADTGEVLGLANQILHIRADVPAKESVAARRERETRESLLWLKGCAAVHERCAAFGPALEGHLEVDLFDRGGDTFENLDAEDVAGRTYVCRSNHNRSIYIGHEDETREGLLHDYARSLPEAGRHSVAVPAREAKPAKDGKPARPKAAARTATVAVAWAAVQIKAPHVKRGKHRNGPLKVWVVRVWEIDPPANVEPLEWLLLSNRAVTTYADACQVIRWYEERWTIEDYHKGQKTGCGIEKPQFTAEERLEPMIALLSVIAVWLLGLRWLSRQEGLKDCPAVAVVPTTYVAVLSVSQGEGRRLDMTAHEFFLGVARLGGYDYYRKGRPPGWLVLWRGWGQLLSRVEYALASGSETLSATECIPHEDLPPDS
jgi:Transposase DNA-binding